MKLLFTTVLLAAIAVSGTLNAQEMKNNVIGLRVA